MREKDKAEIYNLRSHNNPLALAGEVCGAASMGKAAIADIAGHPVALIGITPLWPGVWTAWAFGTDDFDRVALSLTRYAIKTLKPLLASRGAHRLQCESRADHIKAHHWLTAMGAKPESVLKRYGRDGSDYIMFAWRS